MSELTQFVAEVKEIQRAAELALEAAKEHDAKLQRQRNSEFDATIGMHQDRLLRSSTLDGPRLFTPGPQAKPSLSTTGAFAPLVDDGLRVPRMRLGDSPQGPSIAGMEGMTRREVKKALEAELKKAQLTKAVAYGSRLRSAAAAANGDISLTGRDFVGNSFDVMGLLQGDVNVGNLRGVTEFAGAAAQRGGSTRLAKLATGALGMFGAIGGATLAATRLRDTAWNVATDAQASQAAQMSAAANQATRAVFAGTQGAGSFVDFTQALGNQLNVSSAGIKGRTWTEALNPFAFDEKLPTAFEKKIWIEGSRLKEFNEGLRLLANDPAGRAILESQAGISGTVAREVFEDARAKINNGKGVELWENVRRSQALYLQIKNQDKVEQENRQLNPIVDAQYRNREALRSVMEREYILNQGALSRW